MRRASLALWPSMYFAAAVAIAVLALLPGCSAPFPCDADTSCPTGQHCDMGKNACVDGPPLSVTTVDDTQNPLKQETPNGSTEINVPQLAGKSLSDVASLITTTPDLKSQPESEVVANSTDQE